MQARAFHSKPDDDINPYDAPGIERLHHASIYQWPLPSDTSLSFEVEIDDSQLLNCVIDHQRFVTLHFLGALGSGVAFLITGLGLLSSPRLGSTMSFVCLLSLIAIWYFARRSTHVWHVRRLRKQFPWMWGHVQVRVDSDGILWSNDSVEILQHWDSFHQLTWWRNCIWLSTNHPFAMEVPIHRRWASDSTWRDLRRIAESHKGFYDKEVFWRLVRTAPVSFKDVGAPDNEACPAGTIPFRASGHGRRYACEVTASLMQEGGRHWTVLAFFVVSFGVLSPYGRIWDQSLGITKNGYHLYVFYFMLFFSTSLSALMRWFPAGIGFYQWSQTLLGSQSGFVSKNAVRVASPACRFTVNLGSEILLKKECHCIVLELQSGFGQSLVIPHDQFVDASILPQLISSGFETH